MAKANLYRAAREWENAAFNARDKFLYCNFLDELSFQADFRFNDYLQYQQDGTFLTRLESWLNNLDQLQHKQALLQLLGHLVFIDNAQMTAIYRDAVRRIISPWLEDSLAPSIDDMFTAGHDDQQRRTLAEYQIAAVTESCNVSLLLKANDLHGLPRPITLGPSTKHAITAIGQLSAALRGLIICEDIVGSGKQAGRILKAVEDHAPSTWRLLFVPMIAFEDGINTIAAKYISRTTLSPVVILSRRQCLQPDPLPNEPPLFKTIRGITKNTAQRVLEAYDDFDDPPKDPFGYESSGGLLVTSHNAPNNTLPLIHHRAPTWNPLFRRLHHKERP